LNNLLNSVLAALCVGVGFWALPCRGEEAFLLSGPGETNLGETKKAEENVKIVYGHGTGETKEAAEKDACRNAIEFAVGTFIDSETLMKNDKLIKDEILAHSNGYIEKYEVTGASRSTKGLGVEVDVKAWVKIQEAKKKVRDLVPGDTKSAEGLDGILGTSGANGSRAARDKSAAALLKKELDGFDPVRQLVNISLVSQKPTVLTSQDVRGLAEGEVVLRYYCQFYVMQDVYFNRFMPRFTQILEQVSVKKPQVFRPTAQRQQDLFSDNAHWIERMGGVDMEQESKSVLHLAPFNTTKTANGFGRVTPYLRACFELSGFREDEASARKSRRGRLFGGEASGAGDQDNFGRVEVVTKCNSSLTSIKGMTYYLAPSVYAEYVQWFAARFVSERGRNEDAIDYLLRLLDANGEEVAVQKVAINASAIFLSQEISDYGFGKIGKNGGIAVKECEGENAVVSSLVWGPWLNLYPYQRPYRVDATPGVHIAKIFPLDIRLSGEDAKLVKKVSVSLAEAVE
jgi:hypothetical protein